MKKVISFCLWGTSPKYCIGAIKNANLTNKIFNDSWTSRFYCGKSVPNSIIKQLNAIENCEVVLMDEGGNWNGMFWRFIPCSEIDVDIVLSRDCDSRLSLREKNAVDEWLASNKSFHIMRDHPLHTTEILGGMWGVKNPKLSNMVELMNIYNKGNFWQVDQNFLREKIYPIIKNDCFVHDEFFNYNKDKHKFPFKRIGQEFVGEAFDELENPNMQHRSMIK
jgi:hypothetical protein